MIRTITEGLAGIAAAYDVVNEAMNRQWH